MRTMKWAWPTIVLIAVLAIIALVVALAGCGSTGYNLPPPASATAPLGTGTPSVPGLPTPLYTWPPTASCGHERWAVKTATDADAGKIGHTVHTITIASLSRRVPPAE